MTRNPWSHRRLHFSLRYSKTMLLWMIVAESSEFRGNNVRYFSLLIIYWHYFYISSTNFRSFRHFYINVEYTYIDYLHFPLFSQLGASSPLLASITILICPWVFVYISLTIYVVVIDIYRTIHRVVKFMISSNTWLNRAQHRTQSALLLFSHSAMLQMKIIKLQPLPNE